MRMGLLCVGKVKPGPEKLLADDYRVRAEGLGKQAGIARVAVSETAESQAPTAAMRMDEEARFFTSGLPPRAFSVALDERGKLLSSSEFAGLIRRHLETGTADLTFLIGGPDGHAPSTRGNAGLLLSLGPMTWPHRLARVMLLEQIYRAVTILVGHPYHRA